MPHRSRTSSIPTKKPSFFDCPISTDTPISKLMNDGRFNPSELLLSLVIALLSVVPSYAQPSSSKASPTAAATPTTPSDTHTCELHVVDNMIKECCKKVGSFLDRYRNCTNFKKTFDELCASTMSLRNRVVSEQGDRACSESHSVVRWHVAPG
jgi:hypothetical protein